MSGSALPDLAGECFEIVRFAREHGDSIGRSEASDECRAESWTDSGNDRDRLLRLIILLPLRFV